MNSVVSEMTWDDRILSYKAITGYPNSLHVGEDGRIAGIWVMGNNYTVSSGYYGGYPATYLKRVMALFPDKARILHVFSGKVDTDLCPGDTVDSNSELNPTFVDDAQTLLRVPVEGYDLVLADPPYSVEDAEHYKQPMIKRNLVMHALRRLPIGAHIVWLDQSLPMYSAEHFRVSAIIGIMKSTNHRFRCCVIFERRDGRDK